jgi:hypothetical protein
MRKAFLTSAVCITLLLAFALTLPGASTERYSTLVIPETFILDTLTIYNPTTKQCDRDPLVTASNKRIDIHELKAGSIRWMALSRNMLKRWGGALNYGDTIILQTGDPAVDGKWVIQDTMNKKFTNRGDLLFDASRTRGLWKNVRMLRNKKYCITPERGL